jgi:hypothetical protein
MQQISNGKIAEAQDMDPADRALIQSYVEKYVNTGVQPTEKDKATMLELTRKYNIRVNRNPRPIVSRFLKVRKNLANEDGSGIPYVAPPKELSKNGRKKLNTKIRKQENRDRH